MAFAWFSNVTEDLHFEDRVRSEGFPTDGTGVWGDNLCRSRSRRRGREGGGDVAGEVASGWQEDSR